jgi:hypothetical protein
MQLQFDESGCGKDLLGAGRSVGVCWTYYGWGIVERDPCESCPCAHGGSTEKRGGPQALTSEHFKTLMRTYWECNGKVFGPDWQERLAKMEGFLRNEPFTEETTKGDNQERKFRFEVESQVHTIENVNRTTRTRVGQVDVFEWSSQRAMG